MSRNITNRRTTPYLGEQDTAQLIHSSKTHRSMSDAFRDADYATPIWKCETDSQQSWRYMKGMGLTLLVVIAPFYFIYRIAEHLAK